MTSAFEPLLTCKEISERTGKCVSAENIRAACYRAQDNHPLPHVRSGEKRPVIRIRWSTFCNWLKEEELLTVGGSSALDIGARVNAC